MNEVALELVDSVLSTGVNAKFVLFNSWYTLPHFFAKLLKYVRYGISMLKNTKKVYFRDRGREMDVKAIYEIF